MSQCGQAAFLIGTDQTEQKSASQLCCTLSQAIRAYGKNTPNNITHKHDKTLFCIFRADGEFDIEYKSMQDHLFDIS